MIIGEQRTNHGWVYILECDSKFSDKCRGTYTKQRCKLVRTMAKHICKSCHNASIASSGGKKGGPISGRRAIETGQIAQFIAAGKKASHNSPRFLEALRQNGRMNGAKAAKSGQLALARQSAHTPEAVEKGWQTRKRNGTLSSSQPERQFIGLLREWFGEVQTHPYVDGFWLDAYVPSIDTYVQFDGEYYHGLSVPYDQLTPTQRSKYNRDRRADAHFLQKGVRLVRVTDRELYEKSMQEIKERIQR